MAALNKVLLIGNLGADPDTRYMTNGDAVTTIRLATTERYKDKTTGEAKEITEWHRVVFYGRLAEIAGQYLKKGSLIYVEGRIRTRKWQDQTTKQDRYTTEIIADQMQMLPRTSAEIDAHASPPPPNARQTAVAFATQSSATADSIDDDDIPF